VTLRRSIRRLALPGLCLLVLALAAVLGQTAVAGAASGCDLVASPGGSDSAAGTEAAPYRSLQKLTSSLEAGQTACLRSGSYGGEQVWLDKPDTTLKSYPGERATITAFLEVDPDAARAHVQGLRFDAANNGNDAGVKLQADDTVFSDNELTKGGHGICLVAASYNPAQRVVIERNRIYDCGPSDSKWDHDIYLVHSRGAIVRWNVLSGNSGGWGVHLYTDADNTVIEHNVIDGNKGGVIFAGDGGQTSDGNVVRYNAITFSGPRYNVESSWSGGPSGHDNLAEHNCLYSPAGDGVGTEDGFAARDNTNLGGSPYVDREAGDFHFKGTSPCLALVGDVMGKITGVAGPVGAPAPARLRLLLHPARRDVAPGQAVLLTGRVVGGGVRLGRSAAQSVSRRTVRIQYATGRGWRTFGSRRVRNGRFSIRARLGSHASGQVVHLRAVLPKLARSSTVRLRIKR
jgi:hypothetical protein